MNRQIAKEYQRVVAVKAQSIQKIKLTKHNMTGGFFVNRDMSKSKKHSKHCAQRSVRLLIILALLSGFISLTGCAGIHLYNPDKDATASLVKKTSDGINFKAVIEEERKNQTKLLAHELEVVAQNSESIRNKRLTSLLGDSKVSLNKKLEKSINKRFLELEALSKEVSDIKEKAHKKLNDQKDEAEKKQVAYKNALEEYNKALKQVKTNASETAKEEITRQANNIQKALGALEKSGIFGKQSAAKSQIDKIDLILDALVKGEV